MARKPNLAAIDHYLTLQYVPAPETTFAGIAAAGGALPGRRGRSGGVWRDPAPVRYWELPNRAPPADRRRPRCTREYWRISTRRSDCG